MIDKKKRIVDKKAMEAVRKAAQTHEGYYICEYCMRWVESGEVHHIKSKGSGGDDVMENLIFLCWVCHRLAVHQGKIEKSVLIEIVKRRIQRIRNQD